MLNKKSKSTKLQGSLPDKRLNMETYLSENGQGFREKWEGSKDRMLYHLEHCPVHTDPDGGTYGGHFMIYGNGDDDITWGRMILVGPREAIGRLTE